MTVDDEKLEQEFLRLTDESQTTLRIKFGRLLERFVEIHPQIRELKEIIANEEGDISPHSVQSTDQEQLEDWKKENTEAANEIQDLYHEFDKTLSNIGIEAAGLVPDRDEMENTMGERLTDMYFDLLILSSILQSENRFEDDSDKNKGALSKLRSKLKSHIENHQKISMKHRDLLFIAETTVI